MYWYFILAIILAIIFLFLVFFICYILCRKKKHEQPEPPQIQIFEEE